MTARAADGFDAVVVGAGPNGLVGALVLAEAGCRVLVIESAGRIGGALRTEELTLPGFLHDVGATVLPLAVASPAFRALNLPVAWAHPAVPVAHPLSDGAVVIERDVEATALALGRDAPAWRHVVGASVRAGLPLVDALLSPLSARPLIAAAPQLARYGITGIWPAELLARSVFRTERARAGLAGMAAHSVLSLRAPSTAGYGTFMAALAHLVGWPVVAGGTERLADALGDRLRAAGTEVHVGTTVCSFDDIPPAGIVLLDLTPQQVSRMGEAQLPATYRGWLDRYRYGAGVFKLDWALDGPVPWRDPRVAGAATVHVGGCLEEIADSERAVSRGHHPERPFVICVQPCVADATRAPAGSHTLWAYCHVPNGSTRDMTRAIEAQIERFAPGFGDRVLARYASTPAALQSWDANLVGGDIGGGAGDLRQFIARPKPSLWPWAMPLAGMYLCSASTPPGGGVHGMGGWHAAHLALRRTAKGR